MFVSKVSSTPFVAERRTPVAPKPPEPVKPLSQQPEIKFVSSERSTTPLAVTEPGAMGPVWHSASKIYGMVAKFT